MIEYDLKNGILYRSSWILLPIMIFLIVLFKIFGYVDFADCSVNLGSCIFIALAGDESIEIARKDFVVPVQWLIIQMGSILFTLEYPIRDYNLFGRQIIVRCGKKYKWWLSKCIWCALSVLIYWLIGFAIISIFCIIKHFSLSLTIDNQTAVGFLTNFNTDFKSFDEIRSFWLLILVPVTISMALCMLQTLISLLKNEIAALCVSVCITVWSMCSLNPFAFLNYAMFERLSLFYDKGVNVYIGFTAALAIIVCTVLLGICAFNKMDILEVKKNAAN